jgi:hypothetical protein
MSQTTDTRTLGEIREDLAQAEVAQAALEDEIRRLPDTMREAAGAERGELDRLALEGKSPAKRSRYARVIDRRDELPALLWAAKVRALRLQLELWSREGCEALENNRLASEKADRLAQEEREITAKKNNALSRARRGYAQYRERNQWHGQVGAELEALEASGSDPSVVQINPLRRAVGSYWSASLELSGMAHPVQQPSNY